MSGMESCAIVAPSQNSTMLCTTDCGCTTTSIWSKPTPNSSCASITSRPLFISVELSTVIFAPMFHVGCASASATVTCSRASRVRPRNGPPLALSTLRATSDARPARRHCQMAECSESTGMISPPPAPRAWATTGPAAIRLSLFASASRLPAPSAESVAGSPAKPTTAFSTTSASSSAESSASASGRSAQARTRSAGTPKSAACCARRSLDRPAASATTRYSSRWRESTSSAWVPIDPVDPRMATPRVMDTRLGAATRSADRRPSLRAMISAQFQGHGEVVGDRQAEEQAVEPVEHTAVTGQKRAEVLQPEIALDHRLAQVPEEGAEGDQQTEEQTPVVLIPGRDLRDEDPSEQHRRDHARDRALHTLVR